MSRKAILDKQMAKENTVAVEAEVEQINSRPDDIPKETWDLMQENGKIATERLYEALTSPSFSRMRAGDKAKLIALAQNRAYGMPKAARAADNKRRGGFTDMTAKELGNLAHRATLPEYKQQSPAIIEDAEILEK